MNAGLIQDEEKWQFSISLAVTFIHSFYTGRKRFRTYEIQERIAFAATLISPVIIHIQT